MKHRLTNDKIIKTLLRKCDMNEQMLSFAQNICNLFGPEECNIDLIVLSVSILYSLTEKNNNTEHP